MTVQSVLHLAWIVARDRGTLRAVGRSWRNSAQVGLLSAPGSACWYTGFADAPAALVRIVGQVEVIFTISFARFHLRATIRWQDVVGLLLVAAAVIISLHVAPGWRGITGRAANHDQKRAVEGQT